MDERVGYPTGTCGGAVAGVVVAQDIALELLRQVPAEQMVLALRRGVMTRCSEGGAAIAESRIGLVAAVLHSTDGAVKRKLYELYTSAISRDKPE